MAKTDPSKKPNPVRRFFALFGLLPKLSIGVKDSIFRSKAQPFYIVLIVSTLFGIAMDFLKINPVKGTFWTAVINGVLAPFLFVGILISASDRKLMQRQPGSWLSLTAVGIITLMMFGAAAAMFVL